MGLRSCRRCPTGSNPPAQGQVEKTMQDSRHLILHLMPDFADPADLNAWLRQWCREQ